jgi:hypothetical protein
MLFYNGYKLSNSFYEQCVGVNAGWFDIQVPYKWISENNNETCNYLKIVKNHTPDDKGPKILFIKGYPDSGKMEVMLNSKDLKEGYIDKSTAFYSGGDGKILIVSSEDPGTRLRYIDFKNYTEKGHAGKSSMVNCTLVFNKYAEVKEATGDDSKFIDKITTERKGDKFPKQLNRLKMFTEYEVNEIQISWFFLGAVAVFFVYMIGKVLISYELTRNIVKTSWDFVRTKIHVTF